MILDHGPHVLDTDHLERIESELDFLIEKRAAQVSEQERVEALW